MAREAAQATSDGGDDGVSWRPAAVTAGTVAALGAMWACGGALLAMLLWGLALMWLGPWFCSALVWHLSQRRWRRAASYAAAIGAYAALWAGLGARHLQRVGDWEFFLVAYPFYARDAAARSPGADGLIRYPWSERGFAGMNNFEYLVFDPAGRFSPQAQQAHPDGKFGLACTIVAVRPMLGDWVVVTTYNCVL